MAKTIFDTDRVISLATVDGQEDLDPREGVANINPPPADGRCNCCGRHLDQLKPFGKAGDPLVGDFDGALLVKKFRTALPPPDPKIEGIYEQFFGSCETQADYDRARSQLAQEYGEKDLDRIMISVEGGSQVGASWECRNCAVLDIYEFFEKVGYDLEEYYAWKPGLKVEKGSHFEA